jgi:hypothetical protein
MPTFTDNPQPGTLPQWLQQQARQQGTGIALRHKLSEGTAEQLAARSDIQDFYLGGGTGGTGAAA